MTISNQSSATSYSGLLASSSITDISPRGSPSTPRPCSSSLAVQALMKAMTYGTTMGTSSSCRLFTTMRVMKRMARWDCSSARQSGRPLSARVHVCSSPKITKRLPFTKATQLRTRVVVVHAGGV